MNQIESGTALKFNNDIFIVVEHHHVKPGKGSAFVRAKIKNVKTQQVLEKTFRSSDKLDDVELDEVKLQQLYKSGDGIHFMDQSSYEEIVISEDVIGSDMRFLKENLEVEGLMHEGKVLKINLPLKVDFTITHTEPGFKGDTSKAGTKPATIDTGATIQVPLFIEQGDVVRVDTRTGDYVERVKQ